MARSTSHRRLLAVGCVVAALTCGCGLQQNGVDGVVTATGLPGSQVVTDPTTGEAVPGATGSPVPGSAIAPGSSAPSGGGTVGGVTGGDTSSGAYTGGTGSTGGTSGSSGTSGGRTGSGSRSGGSSGLSGSLKLGFMAVTGFSDLQKYFDIHVGDYGDPEKQVQAMEDWVNSHGGLGGVRMTHDVQEVNAQQSSSSNEQNLCTHFADDAHAFAVMLAGQIHPETRNCYASKKVIAIEGSNYGFSQRFYDSLGGWDVQPFFPSYDRAERALIAEVKSRNWLAGDKKVGILSWSDADYQHIVNDVLIPGLKSAGVTSFSTYAVSNADAGQMQSGVNQAVRKFVSDGVQRVFMVGSAPLQPFFWIAADTQHVTFKYALTTYDDMLYEQMNNGHSTDQLVGAMGVGFFPVDDISDNQLPFPQPGMEAQCVSIYKAAGIPHMDHRIDDSYSSKQAIAYCETTLLIKAIADRVGGKNLTKDTFIRAMQGLGTSVQMASSYGTRFAAGRYDGTAAYRVQVYDAAKKQFVFASGNRSMP
jgi:hypothetical protein